jgi:hypothetical protein
VTGYAVDPSVDTGDAASGTTVVGDVEKASETKSINNFCAYVFIVVICCVIRMLML